MSVCHHCGQDIPRVVEWSGLRVTDFGEAFWRGIKFPATLGQAKLLAVLARTGTASRLALEMSALTGSGGCIRVQIRNLRQLFRAEGIPVAITNIRGVGYRLDTIDPPTATSTLFLGPSAGQSIPPHPGAYVQGTTRDR